MNEIVKVFHDHPVRIADRDGEPWFVAADVCKILELTNPSKAVSNLDEDERSNLLLGRQGEAIIISESGMYALVIRSNKPAAREFRKWITAEVLPSIRRTGRYGGFRDDAEAQSGLVAFVCRRLVEDPSSVPLPTLELVKSIIAARGAVTRRLSKPLPASPAQRLIAELPGLFEFLGGFAEFTTRGDFIRAFRAAYPEADYHNRSIFPALRRIRPMEEKRTPHGRFIRFL